MEVLCDNLHQGLAGTVQDQMYNTMPKVKAQLKVLHSNGGQDLGSSHLYLFCDQTLHLPFAGIQHSLQLHAMQVASGHALEWQQQNRHLPTHLGLGVLGPPSVDGWRG